MAARRGIERLGKLCTTTCQLCIQQSQSHKGGNLACRCKGFVRIATLCLVQGCFRPFYFNPPICGRTFPHSVFNFFRAIHRFDSAKSVVNCTAFFLSPR